MMKATTTGDVSNARSPKRNRVPTSCEPCRIRKLRCNRGQPCDTCIRRKKQAICQYASHADRSTRPGAVRHRELGDRLIRLESVVSDFLKAGGAPGRDEGPLPEDSAKRQEAPGQTEEKRASPQQQNPTDIRANVGIGRASESRGVLHVRAGQANYVGSTHWLSILEDIKEVREQLALSDVDDGDSEGSASDLEPEIDIAFGITPRLSIEGILQGLPPRSRCDSLLSHYFNSPYMILPIVHPAKFQKEYEKFWKDPTRAPVLWVALLFSMLSVSSTVGYYASGAIDPKETEKATRLYRSRTVQCLVTGKYSSGRTYGIEALMLYLQSHYIGLVDPNTSVWFVMGIVTRLAMRMGYHKDPRHLPGLSLFEGEMRRRVWLAIFQLDILMSFQLGLPSMIITEECDAGPPLNLNWSDMSPDMTTLPPARPLTDYTPVLYSLTKNKLMQVFKKLLRHTQSPEEPPYDRTLALDGELREMFEQVPELLKPKPMGQSFMDTSNIIMNRFTIELLYQKCLIVLHRRYLSLHRNSPRYEHSRKACIDAALRVLATQSDLNQASQPGGQLYHDRWMPSTLTTADYLLAATVVCFELSLRLRAAAPAATTTTTTTTTTEEHMQAASLQNGFAELSRALECSHRIWASASPQSKQARTASQAVAVMIRKVRSATHGHDSRLADGERQQVLSPLNNLAMLGDSNWADAASSGADPGQFDLPYAGPMSDMLDGSESMNWTLLDQYFQNQEQIPITSNPWEDNSGTFPAVPGYPGGDGGAI